jgi:hypothetical protein
MTLAVQRAAKVPINHKLNVHMGWSAHTYLGFDEAVRFFPQASPDHVDVQKTRFETYPLALERFSYEGGSF